MLNARQSPRQRSIEEAKKILSISPLYLDTETTGLNSSDEIVEVAVVDDDGKVVFQSLVKPGQPIPAAASLIHGIYDTDVQTARSWPIVWQQLQPLLLGWRVVIYNEEFDLRMMQQSMTRYRLPWNAKIDSFDLMKLYAQFRGEWDDRRRSYRYHSLANAGQQCHIALPNAHRAVADTLLTRALLHHIAGAG